MFGNTELIETEYLRQSLLRKRLLGQHRGDSVLPLVALGRGEQSVFLDLTQLVQKFFGGESGPCRLCLPAYVLQQRDAEHAVEGMDTNLLVRPVIHRSPAQPVAVLESSKDLLDMLLPAISSDHLFCSPIAMVGHLWLAKTPNTLQIKSLLRTVQDPAFNAKIANPPYDTSLKSSHLFI